MTLAVRTTLTCPFPRPEYLVQATRDLDRGRITAEASEEAFARAEGEVRALETQLGLDASTEGYLRWADPFRPFTATWGGVSAGTLTRFFETNTFYRQPIFESRPGSRRGPLAPWLPRGPNARALLPGPYTFSLLADLRYSPTDGGGAVLDIARALAEDLTALGAQRPKQLQFLEPALAYGPLPRDPGPLIEAYTLLTHAGGDARTSVWTYFGDGATSFPILRRLPVDVVGVDLFETTFPDTLDLGDKGLGLGCLDPRNSVRESATELAPPIRDVVQRLGLRELWLGPSPPLDLLPFEAAAAKLSVLPELKGKLAT